MYTSRSHHRITCPEECLQKTNPQMSIELQIMEREMENRAHKRQPKGSNQMEPPELLGKTCCFSYNTAVGFSGVPAGWFSLPASEHQSVFLFCHLLHCLQMCRGFCMSRVRGNFTAVCAWSTASRPEGSTTGSFQPTDTFKCVETGLGYGH